MYQNKSCSGLTGGQVRHAVDRHCSNRGEIFVCAVLDVGLVARSAALRKVLVHCRQLREQSNLFSQLALARLQSSKLVLVQVSEEHVFAAKLQIVKQVPLASLSTASCLTCLETRT